MLLSVRDRFWTGAFDLRPIASRSVAGTDATIRTTATRMRRSTLRTANGRFHGAPTRSTHRPPCRTLDAAADVQASIMVRPQEHARGELLPRVVLFPERTHGVRFAENSN